MPDTITTASRIPVLDIGPYLAGEAGAAETRRGGGGGDTTQAAPPTPTPPPPPPPVPKYRAVSRRRGGRAETACGGDRANLRGHGVSGGRQSRRAARSPRARFRRGGALLRLARRGQVRP